MWLIWPSFLDFDRRFSLLRRVLLWMIMFSLLHDIGRRVIFFTTKVKWSSDPLVCMFIFDDVSSFFCSRFASPDLCKCLSAIGNPNHLFVDHVCEIHAIKESIHFYFLGIGNHCVGNNKYISPLLSFLLLYIREWPHWVMKMVGRWLG